MGLSGTGPDSSLGERGGADALDADAPGGGAADAHVACSPSLKGDKGRKRADRQPEQERQPEKASGSDGIEPGTLGRGWMMVRVKPAYLELLLLLMTQAAMVADIPPLAMHPIRRATKSAFATAVAT